MESAVIAIEKNVAVRPQDEPKTTGHRLITIDVLRGVAALGVVLYHFLRGDIVLSTQIADMSFKRALLLTPFACFQAGVFLFFIISGFCIHLRWTKAVAAGNKDAALNFWSFWRRRIRRIYPVYLASLVIYILIDFKLHGAVFSWHYLKDIILHLLLIHNFDPSTLYSIHSVYWTLAIEEQLYLLYFLLVWLRKKFDWKTILIVCVFARVAMFLLEYLLMNFLGVKFIATRSAFGCWIIWVLGAISIEAKYGLVKLPSWCRSLTWAGVVLIIASLLDYYDRLPYDSLNAGRSFLHAANLWILDPLWGLAFFFVVNYVITLEKSWREIKSYLHPVRLMAGLGLISYSLYLMHSIASAFAPAFAPNSPMGAVLVVIAIAIAMVSYRLLEKPFMSSSRVSTPAS
jgi:peptidoglycan/LPS O-acetylase OafA/YrhL